MLAMHPLATMPIAGGGGDLAIKIHVNLQLTIGQSTAIRSGFLLAIGQRNDLFLPIRLQVAIGQNVYLNRANRLLNIGQYHRTYQRSYRFVADRVKPIGVSDFDLVVRVNGVEVPMCQLAEQLTIQRGENQASTCAFVLREKRGEIDLLRWLSKRIEVDVAHEKGAVRIYTGTIDRLEPNLMTGKMVITCSDNRERMNNSLPRSVIDKIGYTCASIHGEFKDKNDELVKRLSTVPASFEYDAMGNGYLTYWEPKAKADFVLSGCYVMARQPTLQTMIRGRVINKVIITMDVNYHLLRQRDISQSFDSQLRVCSYRTQGLPPKVETIKNASLGTGWAVGQMMITGLESAGMYHCTNEKGQHYNLIWNPKQRSNLQTQYKKDKDGNDIVDKDNNKVVDITSYDTMDFTMVYARSCRWDMSKRWVQGVTDRYLITLLNSPSIEVYEEAEATLQASISPLEQSVEWGKEYKDMSTPPAGFARISDGDYYQDAARNTEEANKARMVLIHAAYTQMMASHRGNILTLQTRFMPHIDTRHTHDIDLRIFKGHAKVTGFKHEFNFLNKTVFSEVDYQFFMNKNGKGQGLPHAMAPRPEKRFTPSQKTQKALGNLKVNFNQDEKKLSENFFGFVKKAVFQNNSQFIGIMFKVPTPEVNEQETNANIFERNEFYDIAIPNNPVRVFI